MPSSIGHSQAGDAASLQGPLHGHSQTHRHLPPLIGRLPFVTVGEEGGRQLITLAPNPLHHFCTCALFNHKDKHSAAQKKKTAEPLAIREKKMRRPTVAGPRLPVIITNLCIHGRGTTDPKATASVRSPP